MKNYIAFGDAALQAVTDLEARKREANQELHLLTQNLQTLENSTTAGSGAYAVSELIPADTDVTGSIAANVAAGALELTLEVTNSCVLRGAVLFAEQVFQGESLFVHADVPRRTLVVPLQPQKAEPIDILVKV